LDSSSYFLTTAFMSVSISWDRVPLWDLRPDITSCQNVTVWNLRSCVCGAPFLTRGRVCSLHCNQWSEFHERLPQPGGPGSRICIPQEQAALYLLWWLAGPQWRHSNPRENWSKSKLLYDWRSVSQSLCLGIEHPCGTCDQICLVKGRSYFTTDGQSVSQSVSLGIEHPCGTCDQILLVQGRSYFMTDSQSVSMSWYRAPLWDLRPDITCPRSKLLYDCQSVSHYVLASSTLVGLATRYYLSKVEVALRLPIGQSVCLGIEHPCGTCDQILLPVGMLLSEIWGLVSAGHPLWREDGFEVTLLLTVSRSVCLGIEHPWGTCDQILLPVRMLLSEICSLVSIGCPLWREDGSAICGVIAQWSESLWTRNLTLLSHLRLPQPGGPGSRIYIPQEQGGAVISPGTEFPLFASYDSQSYGESILTLPWPGGPGSRIYIPQEHSGRRS
jgi:hypothetical protein